MRSFILVLALLAGCVVGSMAATAAPVSSPTPTPATTPIPTPTATPGWPGGNSPYIGRYRVTSSTNKKFAESGQLTIFMRTFKAGIPPVISGILALYGKHRSNVFYLTQFSHTDTQFQAEVNLGSYAGPLIGKFVVDKAKGKTLRVTFKVSGVHKITLKFFHFSVKPHP